MKNTKIFFVIIAIIFMSSSLLLPYSIVEELGVSVEVKGWELPLSYVSVFLLIALGMVINAKKIKFKPLYSFLAALSGFFYSVFFIVILTVLKGANIDHEMNLGLGMYFNLAISAGVFALMIRYLLASTKKK